MTTITLPRHNAQVIVSACDTLALRLARRVQLIFDYYFCFLFII